VSKKLTLVGFITFCLMLGSLPLSAATEFPISDASNTSFIAVTDSGASQNRISGGWTSILPRCDALQKSWCINSLDVNFGDGKFKSAKFLRYVKHSSAQETPPVNSNVVKSAISIWSAMAPSGDERMFAIHSVLGPGLFSSSIYAFKEIKSRVRDDRYNQMGHPTADTLMIAYLLRIHYVHKEFLLMAQASKFHSMFQMNTQLGLQVELKMQKSLSIKLIIVNQSL
jgi:hypothetical protein